MPFTECQQSWPPLIRMINDTDGYFTEAQTDRHIDEQTGDLDEVYLISQ